MRAVLLAAALCVTALPAWADARVTVLMDALRLPQLIETLREEGLADAQELNADMLGGQGGAFWDQQIARLYDPVAIREAFFTALDGGLDDAALERALAFFDSERGQRVTEFEIAARRAMMDPDIEEAAAAAFAALPADDAQVAQVVDFITTNDLLELNVALTMSTSYQFSRGLADGDLLEMSDEQILAQVWASEDALRADAETWLNGYVLLSQQPLGTDDIDAYLAFAKSPAGRALNAALFAGYEATFTSIAYGLGRAVAMNAVVDDI
ncbi:hypothetical protein So717_00800 [Roseobacter cerasinus]|uniref:DUF2059 domain-containing protein n=1 Tax=Roseobacter cerasinus TaxID=2602289 RepID=A0A640VKQ3_9RHOB|nr:DUF2059 domain-containing protein [Roseobacter cerasinus]GFE48327.1 hypothetical protein So717_00800 [Roseobacter cerasinus]